MRFWTGFALLAAMFALVIGPANPAAAKPEYTRRTSKDCSFCHVPPGYNLNDAGKYYAEHQHSLKGYAPTVKPKASPINYEDTKVTNELSSRISRLRVLRAFVVDRRSNQYERPSN